MGRTYIRVEPSEDRPLHEDVVSLYRGFRKIHDEWTRRFNPVKDPPTIEFLAVCSGEVEPIRFYFGIEDADVTETLRSTLAAAYPDTYDIYETTVDLVEELRPDDPVYQPQATKPELEPPDPTALSKPDEIAIEGDERTSSDGGVSVHQPGADQGELLSNRSQEEQRILNGLSHLEPVGVHWYGRGEHRADWQTLITRYTQQTKRHGRQKEGRKRRARTSPLSVVLDEMAEMDHPIAFQAVFHRRRYWGWKASRRKARIKTGTDGVVDTLGTVVASLADPLMDEEYSDPEQTRETEGESAREQTDDTGFDLGSRLSHIDKKGTSDTYKVNLRAIAFAPPDDPGEKQALKEEMRAISNGFNNLSGPYYNITGKITKPGVRERIGKHPAPDEVLTDLVTRNIRVTRAARNRLQLILNADELSNFTHVPSKKELTVETQRATRSTDRERAPLPLPEPEKLNAYQQKGVAIGVPLNEHNEELDQPIQLPPAVLNHNYIRSSRIGTGKSISIINELGTFKQYTSGANILIEPKGGGLARNYLRAHYAGYGSFEDVVYIDLPEIVPAMPFFDIRPKLAQGFDRSDAVEDKIIQFDEIMRITMGDQQYESAQISIDLLKNLIKAKFDEEYGKDAFTVKELRQTLSELYTEQKLPELSQHNEHIRERLRFLMGSDEHHFSTVATGAMNRLSILTEDNRVREMLNYIPEWGPLTDENGNVLTDEHGDPIEGYQNGFNLERLVHEDKTIIFDVGSLRDESAKLLSLIFVGQLWDVARAKLHADDVFKNPTGIDDVDEDFVIGCIIDEAKNIADSKLVSDLLSQGREFNLSLGLVMQFPEQMQNDSHDVSVYQELLRNTGTKILGNMKLATDIAKVLSSEDIDQEEYEHRLNKLPDGEWIVDLKGIEYFEEEPRPFSARSLPMPPGHPDGPRPLTETERIGYEEAINGLYNRMLSQYSVPEEASSQESDEDGLDITMENDGQLKMNEGFTGGEQSSDLSLSTHKETAESEPSEPQSLHQPGSPETNSGSPSNQHTPAANSPADEEPNSASSPDEGGEEQTRSPPTLIKDVDHSPMKPDLSSESKRDRPPEPQQEVAKSQQNPSETAESDPDTDGGLTEQMSETESPPADYMVSPESNSPRRYYADIKLTVDTINGYTLRDSDRHFLLSLAKAANRDLEDYHLVESMSSLPGYSDADIDSLLDHDIIEKFLHPRSYFGLTQSGWDSITETPPSLPGMGDLGEKVPHRVGCAAAEKWMKNHDLIVDATRYYNVEADLIPDDSITEAVTYDVAGFDKEGNICALAEVETESNNKQAVQKDYKKIAAVEAPGVWVFSSKEAAATTLDAIQEVSTDSIPFSIDVIKSSGYDDLNAQLDVDGLEQIHGLRNLLKEVS